MKRWSLFLVASVASLPGIASAQATRGNDLTVANMQQCIKALGPDPAHWNNKVEQTDKLVCDGHDFPNASERDRMLRFKAKSGGVQIELTQNDFDYGVAAYTEAPLTQYKITTEKGWGFVEQREAHGPKTRPEYGSLPAPVRDALREGLFLMKQLRQHSWQ